MGRDIWGEEKQAAALVAARCDAVAEEITQS